MPSARLPGVCAALPLGAMRWKPFYAYPTTVRYLGIEVDDALGISVQTEI